MPLTLQLQGSGPNTTGHLIIDRNNLIFSYPSSNDDTINKKSQSNIHRWEELSDAFSDLLKSQLINDPDLVYWNPDPRHTASEHMSEYDKDTYHFHLSFNKVVDFDLIQSMFIHLIKLDGNEDLITKNCIGSILQISEEYFEELKTSGSLKKIEVDYRIEKEDEFKKAEKENKQNEDEENEEDEEEILGIVARDILAKFFENQASQVLRAITNFSSYTPGNMRFIFLGPHSSTVNNTLSQHELNSSERSDVKKENEEMRRSFRK